MKNNRALPFWQRPALGWLFSIKTGLLLLAALAAASIAGTFIPALADREGHELVSALERSQTLVFYSGWYLALLALLAVNITCATLRQVVEKVRTGRKPRFMHGPQFYQTSPNRGEAAYRGGAEAVAEAFRGHGFRVALEGGAYGHATRGQFGHWGSVISHAGFVMVLLGGFASALVAREGFIQLFEGGQGDMIKIPKKLSLEEARKVAAGEMEEPPPREKPLGVTLRCEDFETGFFPRTRIPSHFRSWIAIRPPGGSWDVQPVEVNHSPEVNGWLLHQTSYNEAKELTRYEVALRGPDLRSTLTLQLSPGQRRLIPGLKDTEIELADPPAGWTILKEDRAVATGVPEGAPAGAGATLRATQFEPDFVMDMQSRTVGSKSQNLDNPALRVEVTEGGRTTAEWLFGRDDMKQMMREGMHARPGAFAPELTKVTGRAPDWKFLVTVAGGKGGKAGEYTLSVGQEVRLGPEPPAAPAPENPAAAKGWRVRLGPRVPAYLTVLTLTRNPAIPFIYAGCALMLLGLAVAFGIRRKELWFWVDGTAGRLRVAAMGGQLIAGLDGSTRKILAALAATGTKDEEAKIKA